MSENGTGSSAVNASFSYSQYFMFVRRNKLCFTFLFIFFFVASKNLYLFSLLVTDNLYLIVNCLKRKGTGARYI